MKTVIKKLTVSRLIISVYAFLFLLLIIAGAGVITSSDKISREYDEIIDTSISKLRLLRGSREAAIRIQSAIINETFHPDSPTGINDYSQFDDQALCESKLDSFSKYADKGAENLAFEKVLYSWQKYIETTNLLLSAKADQNKAVTFYYNGGKAAYDSFYVSISALSAGIYDQIRVRDQQVDRYAYHSKLFINLPIGIAIVLLLLLGILVVRNAKNLNIQRRVLKEKDRALFASGRRYEYLFNKSPLPKWVCDRKTLRFYEVNEAALKSYGYSKEEFLRLSVFDLRPPEDHAQLRNDLGEGDFATRSRGIRKHLKKNGEIMSVEVHSDEIIFKGTDAILVVVNDRTEILRAQDEIRESGEMYRSLFHNNPAMIWVCEIPTLKILEVNEKAFLHYGYTREEFLSMTAFDLFPEEMRAELRTRVQQHPSGYSGHDTHIKKNGELLEVEIRVQKISYKGREAALVIGVDISEKMRIEKEINESEKIHRLMFNNAPVAKWLVEKGSMKFLAANDTAIREFGYSAEEFRHMDLYRLFTPDSETEVRKLVLENKLGQIKNKMLNHVKKCGEVIIAELSSHSVQFRGRDAYLVVAYDITKLIYLQKELSEEKFNKQVEVTKATIAGQEKERHELGKELHDNVNQILATAKLYLETAKSTPGKEKEFIEMGKDLINSGINEIRKISKSLVPPSLGKLSLREAIVELCEPVKLTKKKISINTKGLNDESLPGDLKIAIYRIIQEQLNNILKYAQASEISICLRQSSFALDLNVADNGKGFDPAKKRNGIGITNMINRASTFNGNVTIDSAPGKGCAIKVNFKLNDQEAQVMDEKTIIVQTGIHHKA